MSFRSVRRRRQVTELRVYAKPVQNSIEAGFFAAKFCRRDLIFPAKHGCD
jgi:hypothetical protein